MIGAQGGMANADYERWLAEVPLFADLNGSALSELAGFCRVERLEKGKVLFKEGDEGYSLYVILSGSISIDRHGPNHSTVHVAVRGENEHIGEMALIDGLPRSATATVAEPTRVLVLERKGFQQCARKNPDIAFAIMEELSMRVREMSEALGRDRFADVRSRLAEELVKHIERQDLERDGQYVRFAMTVTQEQLAERVGATRETVNRCLSQMKAEKVLVKAGVKRYAADLTRLKRLAKSG